MNNDKYFASLEERLIKLIKMREAATSLAKGMISSTLYLEDLFFASGLNRSLSLLDGFIDMIKTRNLACAGILLRSQIDNCMRIYASFIAADKPSFIEGFMGGKKISDFRDDSGEKMSDAILQKRLEAYDSNISDVYQRSSGYVHLSKVAFHLSTFSLDNHHIEFDIGLPLKEDGNKYLLEGADAFIHYMILLYRLLNAVVESKERSEKSID